MRYRKPDGSEFTIHTPLDEWAEEIKARFTALGCSDEYAESVAAAYRAAVEIPWRVRLR